MQKNVSVILSSPISSQSLKKVLLGYNAQTYRNFEVIIAVASTNNEINNLINAIRDEVFYTIKQFSSNINECLFINNLINEIATNYIVFANGNSIPRFDFIEQHFKNREEGFFLSGEYNSISQEIFEKISEENINSGDCFELSWLKRNGNKNIFSDVFRYSKGLRNIVDKSTRYDMSIDARQRLTTDYQYLDPDYSINQYAVTLGYIISIYKPKKLARN